MSSLPVFDPFGVEAIDDPYPQYRRWREADPLHWSEKLRSWVVFRYDDVAAFFRDDRRLSSDRSKAARFKRRGTTDAIPSLRTVASDPPDHTPVRAILNACLGPRVRGIGAQVDNVIERLLDRLGEATRRAVEQVDLRGEVDLIADFAYPLPITVIADLLDVPEGDRPQFQASSHAVARGMDRFFSAPDASRGLHEIGAYFLQLVQQRHGSAGDDLVHRLLGTDYDGQRLNDLEVVAMCTALVFGGHETTVNLIGNGMLALLREPQQLQDLKSTPTLIDSAVEELLRYDSPAQLISRCAVDDFEWHDKRIVAGDSVLGCLGAANHDPAVFERPDDLNLSRAPNPHLAFGLGTHFCPGAQLSRIEARAAVATLVRRFPKIRLGRTPPVRRPTAVLRGLERLSVRLD
ncbi:MAG: cytochrome P450 [Deltaproteobacteria bacterium]|nr:cytochrome P450 [Deltaproteobacteria bacterium]